MSGLNLVEDWSEVIDQGQGHIINVKEKLRPPEARLLDNGIILMMWLWPYSMTPDQGHATLSNCEPLLYRQRHESKVAIQTDRLDRWTWRFHYASFKLMH